MCGFVVLIEPKKRFSNNILSKIEKKIFHRGPDSGGILNENGISMVFRRLSILDLRKISDQPMVDKKNGVSIVFNGEIYNFLELRKKLVKKGYFFIQLFQLKLTDLNIFKPNRIAVILQSNVSFS